MKLFLIAKIAARKSEQLVVQDLCKKLKEAGVHFKIWEGKDSIYIRFSTYAIRVSNHQVKPDNYHTDLNDLRKCDIDLYPGSHQTIEDCYQLIMFSYLK